MQVTKVRVTALVGNTYHARVHMSTSGKDACTNEVDIDARPSDAINLAVRFNAPVYVNKQVRPLQPPLLGHRAPRYVGVVIQYMRKHSLCLLWPAVRACPHKACYRYIAAPCQAVDTVAHG